MLECVSALVILAFLVVGEETEAGPVFFPGRSGEPSPRGDARALHPHQEHCQVGRTSGHSARLPYRSRKHPLGEAGRPPPPCLFSWRSIRRQRPWHLHSNCNQMRCLSIRLTRSCYHKSLRWKLLLALVQSRWNIGHPEGVEAWQGTWSYRPPDKFRLTFIF